MYVALAIMMAAAVFGSLVIFICVKVAPGFVGAYYLSKDGLTMGPYYRLRSVQWAQKGNPLIDPYMRLLRGGEIVWKPGRYARTGMRSGTV